MEMTGEQLIPASQQDTWQALNDPDFLKQCVPGCESIDRVSDTEFLVNMTARVGPVSAKFKGKMQLSDLKPPHSYALAFEGQGGPVGFAKGGAQVRLSSEGDQTRLAYDVKASVGGKLAQIGSRLVDAAAKKVADDFFRNFNQKVASLQLDPDATVIGQHRPEPEPEPRPVRRDAPLPTVSETTLAFFAAGSLLVFIVALVAFFG